MSSFLMVVDSQIENDENKKVYGFIANELITVGYEVFTKKFSYETKLPIFSTINDKIIDYIIIDVPKRVKLSELFSNFAIQNEKVSDYLVTKGISQSLIEKKSKLPYLILFADGESIDVKPAQYPIFIEDIFLKNQDLNLVLAKLALLIKRHSIEYFNKYKTQRLIKIFNSSNIIIMELDDQFSIKFSNRKGLETFGNSNEIIDNNFFDTISKDNDYKKALKYIFSYNLASNKTTFNFESIIKEDASKSERVIFNWLVEIIQNKSNIEAIIAVGYEITSQMRTGEEIEKLAESLVQENKRLNEQIEINKKSTEMFQREMNLAKKIQNGIIPRKFPELLGANISATYVPMDAVGGDFYDVFKFESSFGVILSDVVGHGIPAALITSMTKVLSYNSARRIFSPKVFIETINKEISKLLVSGNFITFFAIHYDYQTKVLKYASGGHIPQILYKRNTSSIQILQSTGPVLGILPVVEYEEKQIYNVKSGDRILLFTDGITETKNKKRELYGMERFTESIQKHSTKNIEEFKEAILSDIAIFSKGVEVEDDVSLIIIDIV